MKISKIVGPRGPYRCIYLDPPWPERGAGKSKRGADRHYETMTVGEIRNTLDVALDGPCQRGVPIEQLKALIDKGKPLPPPHWRKIANDAHCWMWVTDNYLEAGLSIMASMGFKYKRTLVWVKTSPGNIEKWAKLVVEHVREPFALSQDPVTDRVITFPTERCLTSREASTSHARFVASPSKTWPPSNEQPSRHSHRSHRRDLRVQPARARTAAAP